LISSRRGHRVGACAAAVNGKDDNMIRIGIVDDHVLIREGVKKILQKISDMEVIAETDNIPQLFRLIPNSDMHVLVLDINIPGHSGLDAVAEVKKRWPQLPILVLSMHPEETFALRALKAGASGEERLHQRLSNREFQIMRMIAAGRTVGQISTDISLSTNTINTYRARILEKMGMRSNAELIRYAVENHLID
jgi:two-component system, NarL family, invasion response regulator UvrY